VGVTLTVFGWTAVGLVLVLLSLTYIPPQYHNADVRKVRMVILGVWATVAAIVTYAVGHACLSDQLAGQDNCNKTMAGPILVLIAAVLFLLVAIPSILYYAADSIGHSAVVLSGALVFILGVIFGVVGIACLTDSLVGVNACDKTTGSMLTACGWAVAFQMLAGSVVYYGVVVVQEKGRQDAGVAQQQYQQQYELPRPLQQPLEQHPPLDQQQQQQQQQQPLEQQPPQQQQQQQQHYLHAQGMDPNVTQWSNPIHTEQQHSLSPLPSPVDQQQELTQHRDPRWGALRAASHWASVGQQAPASQVEQHDYGNHQQQQQAALGLSGIASNLHIATRLERLRAARQQQQQQQQPPPQPPQQQPQSFTDSSHTQLADLDALTIPRDGNYYHQ
jgi:hypothetical protein